MKSKIFKNKKAISAILMIFFISLMFIALFFSVQKIKAQEECGNNIEGCPINPYDECDFEDMDCEDMYGGGAWNLLYGNSPSGCWLGKCCGDDSGEYAVGENTYSEAIAFDNNQLACCDGSSDCVAGTSCYNSTSAGTSYGGLNSGGNDNYSHCYNSSGTGKWLECDQSDFMDYWCGNVCGPKKGVISPRVSVPDANWNAVASGMAVAHGEYISTDISTSKLECCGDDVNESYVYRNCDNSYACTDNLLDDACCNSTSYCVSSGTCYSSGSHTHDVDVNGDDEYCSGGRWYDCYDTGDCDPVGEYAYTESSDPCVLGECRETCSSNDCIYQRYQGNGDCDSSNGCYGDCILDTLYATTFIGTGMCDNSVGAICTGGASDQYDICVERGWNCLIDYDWDDKMADCTGSNCLVALGGTFDLDNDGDLDYCNNGMWIDCTSDTHCGTGQYCSNNDCINCPCTSGACCDGCFPKTSGSQPTGFIDDINGFCTGTNGATLTSYVYTKDYYCNGTDPDVHYSNTLGDTCGTCEYCSNNDLTCNSYSTSTSCGTCKVCNGSSSCSSTPADDSECGTIDCDGLDTTCRNYNDLTSNRCEGFGDCKDANTADCTIYTNNDTTTCRLSADVCDVAEICSGGSCPTDVFESNTTECRADAGVCDIAETCTGSSSACPSDSYESDWTDCGLCEYCRTGSCINVTTAHTPGDMDPNDDCAVGDYSCNGDCQRRKNSGNCGNDIGACAVNDESDNIDTGYVCTGEGVQTAVSSTNNCLYWENCDEGDCSATKYYNSCNGSGACRASGDTLNAATVNVIAEPTYSLTSSCGTTGTILCSSTDYCSGDGWYTGKVCDGSGNCSVAAGSISLCSDAFCKYDGDGTYSARVDSICTNGSCGQNPYVSCEGYVCSGTTCKTSCTSNTDCISDYGCSNGSCTACECTSGACCSDNCNLDEVGTICGDSAYNDCNGACQKKKDIYKCTGTSPLCPSTDQGDSLVAVTNGKVCSGSGAEINVTTSIYCSTMNHCTDGACSGTKYYFSCDSDDPSGCDLGINYPIASETVYAASGYSLTSTCGTTSNTQCNTTDYCSGDGWYTGKVCDGSGNCSVAAGSINECSDAVCKDDGNSVSYSARVDSTCSGAVCSLNDYVSCGNYSCNGTICRTSCTDYTDGNTHCASGYYCLSESCVSGLVADSNHSVSKDSNLIINNVTNIAGTSATEPKIMGTIDREVNIINGSVQLSDYSYLIWGSKLTLEGTGKLILDADKLNNNRGAAVRAGEEIISGPLGKLVNPTTGGQTACFCASDQDGDGYWIPGDIKMVETTGKKDCSSTICQDPTVYKPMNTLIASGDCHPLNPNIHFYQTVGTDKDGDLYITEASANSMCVGDSSNFPYEAPHYKDGAGNYTQLGVLDIVGINDCYDSGLYDWLVHPDQTEYFNHDRGDDSFDFNCDDIIEYKYGVPSMNLCYNEVYNYTFVKRLGNVEYTHYCSCDRCGYKWTGYENFVTHCGSGGVGAVTGCKEPFDTVTMGTRAAYRR